MASLRRRLALISLGLGSIALLALPASAAKDDVVLVSVAPNGSQGDGDSFNIDMSADGNRIAFNSTADNLSPDDDDTFQNVFVRDVAAGTTTLANRASGPAGVASDSLASGPKISGDGRYVVFQTSATNLSADDDPTVGDVFRRDLVTHTTELVSRASGPTGPGGDGNSFGASISHDGRYIAFDSRADNLSADDSPGTIDVFVRDMQDDVTVLVSRASGAAGPGADDDAFSGDISADGRHVAFETGSDNLSADDTPMVNDVFVRDLDDDTTTLASRATGASGDAGDNGSFSPQISRDGTRVAFRSFADNLAAGSVDPFLNVFLRDLATGQTTLISRQSDADGGAGADAGADLPSISDDGRYVGFDSSSDNLSPDDLPGVGDIFVHDTALGVTTLVSRAAGPAGAAGDDDSETSVFSGEGRFIAFASQAENLVPNDSNTDEDVFRRQLLDDPSPPPGPPAPPVVVTGTPAPANCRPVAARGTPNPVEVPSVITAGYLATNQRTGSATIRRARGIEAWLNSGIVDADICGGAISDQDLNSTLIATVGGLGPAPPPASPRPVQIPDPQDKGEVTFRADALQMCTNQRVFQLGILWAEALKKRIEGNLRGGDIADGTLTQGRLRQDLGLSSGGVAATIQSASETDLRTPERAGCQTVSFTPTQAAINRKIAIASVVRINELLDLLAGGLRTEHFADGTIARVDLAPGVVS